MATSAALRVPSMYPSFCRLGAILRAGFLTTRRGRRGFAKRHWMQRSAILCAVVGRGLVNVTSSILTERRLAVSRPQGYDALHSEGDTNT